MATIYELKRLAAQYGLDKSLREVIKAEMDGRHKCPKCLGKGYVMETFSYPIGDYRYGSDDELRTVECSLCSGEGYTRDKFKAVYKLDGYKKV